jgi:hypothetical protein
MLHHVDDASLHVEASYQMDKRNAFSDPKNAKAYTLVKAQLAKAAALLRDLTYTAWVKSTEPVERVDATANPISRTNPHYNPATGSAPPVSGSK